jgi:hypothetical protein
VYAWSGSECKELLARLGWREAAQALDDPELVVAFTKFCWRAPQLFYVFKCANPQQLPLEHASEPLDAAAAFRLAYKTRR